MCITRARQQYMCAARYAVQMHAWDPINGPLEGSSCTTPSSSGFELLTGPLSFSGHIMAQLVDYPLDVPALL